MVLSSIESLANVSEYLANNVPHLAMSAGDIFLWIFKELINILVGGFLGWLLEGMYVVGIWLPLQTISVLTTCFKFFATGLLPFIFGSTKDANGNYTITITNFSWYSTFGIMILFIFALSLFIFFFYFILSFNRKDKVDDLGNPISSQTQRLIALRWPFLMILLLVGTPFILTVAEVFISYILAVFLNQAPQLITSQDIINFKRNIFDPNSSSTTAWTALNTLGSEKSGIYIFNNHSENFYAGLMAMQTLIKNINTQINSGTSGTNLHNVSALLNEVNASILKILNYQDLMAQDGEDYAKMIEIVNGIKADAFTPTDQTWINDVKTVINDLKDYQNNVYYLADVYSTLMGPGYADAIASLQLASTDNIDPFLNYLSDVNSQLYSGGIASNNALDYYLSYDENSMMTTILYGSSETSGNTLGLINISRRTNVSDSFQISQTIYQLVTGDPQADNWTDMYSKYFLGYLGIHGNWNPASFFFGCFFCWAMVLMIYKFVSYTVKRTFYLVGYWIVGWIFLAGGIKNPGQAKNWYRIIFGRWISVIVLFASFCLMNALLDILNPIIKSGLEGLAKDIPLGDTGFGDLVWKQVTPIGLLIAMESGYMVAYQLFMNWGGYWGVSDESFSNESSTILSEGKGMYEKVKSNAKDVATLKPVREKYKEHVDRKIEKESEKTKDLEYSNAKLERQKQKLETADLVKNARKSGYGNARINKNNFLDLGQKTHIVGPEFFNKGESKKLESPGADTSSAKPSNLIDNAPKAVKNNSETFVNKDLYGQNNYAHKIKDADALKNIPDELRGKDTKPRDFKTEEDFVSALKKHSDDEGKGVYRVQASDHISIAGSPVNNSVFLDGSRIGTQKDDGLTDASTPKERIQALQTPGVHQVDEAIEYEGKKVNPGVYHISKGGEEH